MLKKVLKFIVIFLVFILIFDFIVKWDIYKRESVILWGYYDESEKKVEDTWLNVYYYYSECDDKFKKHENYKRIDDNIEDIYEVIDAGAMSNHRFEYELTNLKEIINEEDYFYVVYGSIDYNIRLYVYDISEHTLYYWHRWD